MFSTNRAIAKNVGRKGGSEPSRDYACSNHAILILGRFELMKYHIVCANCSIKQNPFTLKNILQSGFWPCSPNTFNCLVHVQTFILWDQFRKQMPGSSEKSFLESLNALTYMYGRVSEFSF